MDNAAKKRKGGAEKQRDKKRKALATDAATSKNISEMFAAGASVAGAASGVGPSQQQVSDSESNEAPAAMLVQEQEVEEDSPPCGSDDRVLSRCVPAAWCG